MADDFEQSAVLEFLGQPSAWPGHPSHVEIIETHAAIIFMAGDEVLKVKRAVKLAYLDFSTLEARRHFLVREFEINAPQAPDLYLGLVAIRRQADGSLAVGGSGEAVDWALRMRRFGQDRLLSRVVAKDGLSTPLAGALADAVVRYHGAANRAGVAVDPMPAVVGQVTAAIRGAQHPALRTHVDGFAAAVENALAESAEIRQRRARGGYIRRCHGDLHLGNIVIWNGMPVAFDAIEFDEALATIDTLYDLAFLLMDLERHGARAAANTVLNRYLWRTGDPMDLAGLEALPLFLATRAGVRAMVALDRARVWGGADAIAIEHVAETLRLGTALATPPPARLIAAGGLSGTGKSTLAAALAPSVGAAPGAIHIRTDLERKWLAGAGEFERLAASSYSPESAAAVYRRVMERAEAALGAGHSVIVDGVLAAEQERSAVERLAQARGVAFSGLWLEASPDVMMARVGERVADASDATPAVVHRQLALQTGDIAWTRIDANGLPGEVVRRALDALSRCQNARPDGTAI